MLVVTLDRSHAVYTATGAVSAGIGGVWVIKGGGDCLLRSVVHVEVCVRVGYVKLAVEAVSHEDQMLLKPTGKRLVRLCSCSYRSRLRSSQQETFLTLVKIIL